jgi:hypothetical protein
MGMKIKNSLFFAILLTASASYAGDSPTVGLWEKFPISDGSSNLVARPQYVFTNKKLDDRTIFTGLREVGTGLSVLCCIIVKNTMPLILADVVRKYAIDPEFVNQMKSVQGLSFMYEAEPVGKADRNAYFQTVMNTDNNPDDLSPFSAPVVAVSLGEQNKVKPEFQVGQDKFYLKVTYPKNKNITNYEFKINEKIIDFSENSPAH